MAAFMSMPMPIKHMPGIQLPAGRVVMALVTASKLKPLAAWPMLKTPRNRSEAPARLNRKYLVPSLSAAGLSSWMMAKNNGQLLMISQ